MSALPRASGWRWAILITSLVLLALSAYLFRDAWATSRLESHQRKWRAQQITHYRYSLATACMCAVRPGAYEVRDDEPVAHPGDGRSYFAQEYATVDGLFSYVQQIIAASDGWVSVEYDSQYGYPKRVLVRPLRPGAAATEELAIRHFEVLP